MNLKLIRGFFVVGLALTVALVTPHMPIFAQDAPAPREIMSAYELMEALYDPLQIKLSEGLAAEPADKGAWRDVRQAAFSLSELGNLLFIRTLEEGWDKAAWDKASADNRDKAEAVALAAKERDYAATKTAYTALIESCNTCHTTFAPDLAPVVEP